MSDGGSIKRDDTADRATAPNGSAWVGANAGSGKTYVLVSRLVRLMLDGTAPEKLLCLTYTRSAAAEMQERLYDLLAEWALMDDAALRTAIAERLGPAAVPEALARARTLFARALETPGGLRVQTIHAFCESLLKRFPLEAGLSPQFELMDEADAAALQATLIAETLSAAPDTQLAAAMARLTRALGEADLAALGRLVISRRAALQAEERPEKLAALAGKLGLASPPPAEAALLQTALAPYADEAAGLADWLAGGSVTDRRKADALTRFGRFAAAGDWPAAFAALQQAVLKKDGGLPKDLATKGRVAAAPDKHMRLVELADMAADLRGRCNALLTYEMTAAIFDFAETLLGRYAAEKARRAVLDYDDLIDVSNRLLDGRRAAQWVLFKIDQGLQHILVDEAQDTSPAQWRVIRALADEFFADDAAQSVPRTMFAVGDEKQSIFSFQGADPAEFEKQFDHFSRAVGALGGELAFVPLTRSRRSVPQILQLVDLVFADAARRAGVTAGGRPMTHSAFRDTDSGHVEIWPPEPALPSADDGPVWAMPEAVTDDPRRRLAERIAGKIATLLADPKQNVTAGDMLILVRKRDGFVEEMIRALKRRRIEVAGADRMVLLEQLAVMDVLAALDAALNPDDDMALAVFLRSPLGGVSEETLLDLAHGRKAGLWPALRQAAGGDGPDARPLQPAFARLDWLMRQADRLPPHDLLAQFLGARGGHKALAARLGPEIDDPLGELLRLALAYEARHAASLQGFVHWLRQGGQEIKRDMERSGAAVRIMTVHGAKGLEAPIVFLPDTCRPPVKRGGAPERLQLADGRLPLWRAASALQAPYGTEQAAAAAGKSAEEERRLLYVALTRARDRLYVGGWLGKRDKGPAAGSWYDMIAEALGDKPDALAAGETPLPPAKTEGAPLPPAPPLPDWLHRPPPQTRLARAHFGDKLFSPSSLDSLFDDAGAAPDKTAEPIPAAQLRRAAARGRLVHKLLQYLPDLPVGARRDAALSYLQAAGAEAGFAGDEQAAMADEAMAVMEMPQLAALFGDTARAEVPVAGLLAMADGEKLALSGQIDRMVETPDGLFLVDFKTGTPPPAGAAAAADSAKPPRHYLQMAAYRALMQAARPGLPVACALIWTQSGRVDALPAAELEAALAALLDGTVRLG